MRNSRDTRRRRRRRRQRWRRVGHFFCHRRGKMTKRRMIINVIGRTDKENNESRKEGRGWVGQHSTQWRQRQRSDGDGVGVAALREEEEEVDDTTCV
ncbi:unnamed protein product [Onchocerca ochengi]|uniref:Uncharacterized protein n=1 Tax=Onchocerca ochengi TaxID=42157 RepID=A0A182ESM5_ONCOC|nr:unnamed protein product [Onchocerca ochengi]VDM92984.1 unnamed protein product [Onchocerca ochengi]VDM94528.1 unnamed protein product [Onchocerca ochengi]VDM95070.1 unnamed protein product [Onchocerca ochengi]